MGTRKFFPYLLRQSNGLRFSLNKQRYELEIQEFKARIKNRLSRFERCIQEVLKFIVGRRIVIQSLSWEVIIPDGREPERDGTHCGGLYFEGILGAALHTFSMTRLRSRLSTCCATMRNTTLDTKITAWTGPRINVPSSKPPWSSESSGTERHARRLSGMGRSEEMDSPVVGHFNASIAVGS